MFYLKSTHNAQHSCYMSCVTHSQKISLKTVMVPGKLMQVKLHLARPRLHQQGQTSIPFDVWLASSRYEAANKGFSILLTAYKTLACQCDAGFVLAINVPLSCATGSTLGSDTKKLSGRYEGLEERILSVHSCLQIRASSGSGIGRFWEATDQFSPEWL